MAIYNFDTFAGSTIDFQPASDILEFSSGSAADILVTADDSDIVVSVAGQSVRLASLSFDSLSSSHFLFADAGVVEFDAAGGQSLSGSSGSDYFDISHGGADSVSGSGGDDRVVVGGELDAGDVISGGDGQDEVRLSGSFTVVLGAATITAVERLTVGDGTVSITLADQTVTSASSPLLVDASTQNQASSLTVDGRHKCSATVAHRH